MAAANDGDYELRQTTLCNPHLPHPPSPTEQSVAARGADGPTRSGCCGCEPVRTGRPTIPAVSQSDSSGRRIGRAEGSSGEVRAVWGLHSSGVRVVSWLQPGVLLEESSSQVRELLPDLAVYLSHPVTGILATLPPDSHLSQSQG